MTNPLLNFDQLPSFSKIKPKHAIPALEVILEENRSKIKLLSDLDDPTWQNFALEMEHLDERLSRVWSPVGHLNGVQDSDALREAYQQGIALLTEYHSEVGQNLSLYKRYKLIESSDQFSSLTDAQKKVVTNNILDFQLSGAELDDKDQARLKEINLRLADLSNQFGRNLLDATEAWTYLIEDVDELKGMPSSSLEMAQQMANDNNQEGWLLSLQIPSYLAVMQHVENSKIRKKVYQAYSKRASELSDNGNYNNGPLIDEILQLRHERSVLLGFEHYAEYSLVKKMAKSKDEVNQFLDQLVSYAKPLALEELAELKNFAQQEYQKDELDPWDLNFFSERLREQRYSFSDEEVKEYFPAHQVFNGMFEIVSRLFNVEIIENNQIETWHEDVTCYDIKDKSNDFLVGNLYADIYVRKNKRGGAWMDTCIHRRMVNNTLQLPVAFLTCNFSPPTKDSPALLTHNEVETLFHEFGHTLHHLLSKVNEMSVSGINGVAWDAVELPSQFLENWCWQPESISLIARHYKTGETIPSELLKKMRSAKNFQSAMQTLRQVEFASFDMRLHSELDPTKIQEDSVQTLLDEVRSEVSVVKTPEYNRFQNSFSHIFAGGYAAGYYSYKWAEVLSADAFQRFENEGIFNQSTGESFKQTILEKGGVEDAAVLFNDFRGRDPKIEPLLKQTGIL